MKDHDQAKCNAIRAQIAAKKATDKAAIKESKQKARLAAKKAKLSETNACVSTKGSRKKIKSSVERSINPSGKRRKNCIFCKCSMKDHDQAKCNAIRAQIAAKKATNKAAIKESKQKARLAAKKAKLS
ncbi:hypothetical protein CTI12_AA255570 [Artemisia annua]|uniref:Uncharacterized protein n=1 Tax=Artemisia annua TaxID=35608 RepID=A0A2U1NKA1_ARTAN|nr:hypothetical protein CTI12_AA255570 [Artemisia annua]